MPTLLWLQTGGCSGDSMSLLCARDPDLLDLLSNYGVELLWHPSLSLASPKQVGTIIDEILTGGRDLTFLCIEGAILTGPDGTGLYDTFLGRPKMDLVRRLADRAKAVVAVGTCAAFGGMAAAPPNPTDAIGLQFLREAPGGLLGAEWRSPAGLPVINLSGCPAHASTLAGTIVAALLGVPLDLDAFNRPRLYYNQLVHQGCTRNEYHEFDVEEFEYGGKGCLFFNLGCQGPNTQGPCNTVLWNGRNSKTRAGIPCFGCTEPSFPKDHSLFRTNKIADIPVVLPQGVHRVNYLAYKGLAKAASPERLLERVTDV